MLAILFGGVFVLVWYEGSLKIALSMYAIAIAIMIWIFGAAYLVCM